MTTRADEDVRYTVVVNHEEQYSIWPADRELPDGWMEAGRRGTREECLDHIERVWTDMRPLSLRRSMEADETGEADAEPAGDDDGAEPPLVERLTQGDHPVELAVQPESLQDAIARGYVLVRFTDTRGGTELGVRLEEERTDLAAADFASRSGRLVLGGTLLLDSLPVRCSVDLDLATLRGRGRVELLVPS